MMKKYYLALYIFIIFLTLNIPYFLAWNARGSEYEFTGFILNPVDGASYLAKMYQGWLGSWTFILPYTVERGTGAYIFLYYLFLGHLARWTHLPLIWVYHLARGFGSIALLISLVWFLLKIFTVRVDSFWKALFLISLGSGLGWILVFTGRIPFDMWVAEAFPFLSMYINPHFPLGLAIFVYSLGILNDASDWKRNIKLAIAGVLISIIYPFGFAVFLGFVLIERIWRWYDTRSIDWLAILCSGSIGGPYLLYQFLTIHTDPLLAGWNAQNITLTPVAWDVFLSLSPAIILAIPGALWLVQQKDRPQRRILLIWPILSLILMYFPFTLQRRFSFGVYIPLAILAIIGVEHITQINQQLGKLAFIVLITLSLPTNVFLLASGVAASSSHPNTIYLTRDERLALDWMRENLQSDELVLASPEMGAWIPAFTGRRVIYGHPFETVGAVVQEQSVRKFYSDSVAGSDQYKFLDEWNVDVIFYGPRERGLGGQIFLDQGCVVFTSGEVSLFKVMECR